MRDVPAVALDRPNRRPAEGDGLLPLHIFDRVTFDGPARSDPGVKSGTDGLMFS